ncbi:SGNH hydrolase domain-containing protein [Aeromonas jandaei]
MLNIEFTLLFIGLTLLLSMFSYYGIERAFRPSYLSKKQLVAWLLLVLSVLCTSQSMAKVNAVLTPGPLPIEYQRYADPATICHGQMVGDCLKGDLNSEKEILVLGDSHAAMLNHFFDYLGKALGFKARIITASSCVTIPGFNYQRLPEWARKECITQIEQAKAKIEYADNIFLAASWSWQLESKDFEASLIRFLNDYAPKANMYLISQEPLLNQNPQRNLRFISLGLNKNNEVNYDYLRANEYLKNLSMKYGHVKYLDLSSLAVFDNVPFYKNKVLYYDEHHLNEVGALEYAKHAFSIFKNLTACDE